MKKILVPVMFAACITFSAVSCKKENAEEGTATVEVKDEGKANEIIEFNNNFLSKYRNRTSNVDKMVEYANKVEGKIKGTTTMLFATPIMPSVGRDAKLTDAFGKDKEAFEKMFADLEAKYKLIADKYETLKAYMAAEDYKDDKGAKAAALRDEINAESKSYFELNDAFHAKLRPVAEAAENIILKDHPLKEYIIGSKKVLSEADELVEQIYNQYEAQQYDTAVLQAGYDKLEKALKENEAREFKVSDAQYEYKKSGYQNFNKSIESYLGTIRKEMRDAASSKKFTDAQIGSIESAYKSVISNYNSFVD